MTRGLPSCLPGGFCRFFGLNFLNIFKMAGRRVAKSAVNWAKFAESVPKGQLDSFRAFKAKSDSFVSK